MNCSACYNIIDDDEGVLRCSRENCGKLYHPMCTGVRSLMNVDIDMWTCPECRCAIKRGGNNSFTPVGAKQDPNVTIRKNTSTLPTNNFVKYVDVDSNNAFASQMHDLRTEIHENKLEVYAIQVKQLNEKLEKYEKPDIQSAAPRDVRKVNSCSTKLTSTKPTTAKQQPVQKVDNSQQLQQSSQQPKSIDAKPTSQTLDHSVFTVPSQECDTDDDGDWTEVKKRSSKRRHQPLHGTADPQSIKLKAIEIRRYCHFWNMASNVDEVREYLSQLYPTTTCSVEELNARWDYKSYKIGVPVESYASIYSAEIWPLNARIKPWINYKRSSPTSKIGELQNPPVREPFLLDSELEGGDWCILRRDRNAPCGGVLLAARTPLVLRRRREYETECGEDLWASFVWHGLAFLVCVMYIKPSASDEDYMSWFCKTEGFIQDFKGFVLIMGDLNLNSASNNIINYYYYFLSFCSLVDKNDIFNVHGGKLDVILVREGFHEVFVSGVDGIVQPDAYHPPLDVEVRVESVLCSNVMDPSNINPARDWNFHKCDYVQLYSLLSETSWDSVLRAVSVADAVNAFYQIIYDTFDACMPKKRRSGRVAERYPVWFTSDIIQDIKRKLALHAAWKRSKCLAHYKTFSDLRSNLKHRAATAYQTYIKRVENNIRVNPREFWRHICSLRSKGGFEPSVSYCGESYSGAAAAEVFAKFFASVFLPDIPILNVTNIETSDISKNSNYINIFQFSSKDVLDGLNKLKVSSSVGPDSMPPTILKHLKYSFISTLCHIFNLSLKTGFYPIQWKVSRVTPIPKTSDKTTYLVGCLGFNMLDTRRTFNQLHIALKIYRGIIDAPDLHNELVRLYAPNNYIRARRHRLLSVPACRTVARASSPIPRVLSALNSLMEAYPDCDLFVDDLKTIKRVCLSFCESL
ncbi:hypothetical protein SFRURICE_006181 [Spodoptera frugiperda]|nr:hypothetical protein SFRURICE_006181 [Spodoptera frugiperda]